MTSLPATPRHDSASHRSRRGPRRRAFGAATHYVWLVGVVICVMSFGDGPAWLLAVGGFWLAAAFILNDARAARRGGLTPITVFAFASTLTALANATGLLAARTPLRDQYFTYAADEFLLLATQLFVIGMVATILGFTLARRTRAIRTAFDFLPRVRGEIPDRALLVGGPIVAFGAIALHVVSSFGAIGSVLSTVYLLPHIVAFLLARAATERHVRRALGVALLVAAAEGARALFTAYLRTDIIAPFVAVALGALLGARSLSPLRSKLFIPLYAFAACFIIYFGAFARARSTNVGLQRLQAVATANTTDAVQQKQSFWARLTNFNQLSQVGRIASEDGYLHGETLQYLAFVFVPRFLWPDKPIIQKGGWFAWRIGQARILPNGRYSNAVNMTVPGELYLNFGWFGVIAGCLLFGAYIYMLWSRTAFWSRHASAIGAAFGYYLFWTSLTLAADLQTIVTLLSTYCIFVACGVGLRALPRRRAGTHGATAAQRVPGPVARMPAS